MASVVDVDDEATLVRRVRGGDEQSFVKLVTAHRGAAWAVCLRITGNPHDAEDALQDALVAAWRNVGGFRADSRFSTWLFRIAANAALAVVRRRAPVSELAMDGPSDRRDPADRVADAQRVQEALMTLPEGFRVAFVLRIYGDFSYHDIAIHQGIPVQTVKSRLSRAHAMLQDLLTQVPDTIG